MCAEYVFGLNDVDKSILVEAWTTADSTHYAAGAFNTAGIQAWYRLQGATSYVQIAATGALITQTINGVHTDGGFIFGKYNSYRLDVPDAVLAAVGNHEVLVGGVTGVQFNKVTVKVMGVNPFSVDGVTIAPDGLSAASVSAAAVTKIRDGILNWEPFTGFTLAKLFRVKGIVLHGTKAGSDTASEVFTAPAGGATVTATVDASGNRTVVSTTASGTP